VAKQLEKGRVTAVEKGRASKAEAPPEEAPKKKGKKKLILLLAVVLLIVAGGGGGAYFYLFAGAKTASAAKETAPAKPFFVEIKPFVVTDKATDGSMHYVQLALSLKVPNEEAIAAAGAVMPEIQDMIRQKVLGFKTDDLQTQDGVNKLRAAITAGTNQVLLGAIGAPKLDKLGAKSGMLVSNVFFQNLVIE
jgi:flagellar FliL protein